VSAGAVFLAALGTALATGLGALPFAFRLRPPRTWLALASALAATLMFAASVGLAWEGWSAGPAETAAGLAAGGVFIATSRVLLGRDREVHFGLVTGADARRMLLIVGVMTIHSITEGVGVGVSFGQGERFGLAIAVAMAVHNVPEGLAISLVLIPRGVSVRGAAGWSVFSSLPQPLMAVPAFLFFETFQALLPLGLGFAAGAMLWMVAAELVPDAVRPFVRRRRLLNP
jgi:zinc transporter, ZIP family